MEFVERVDVNSVKWLLSQLSNEFIQTHVLDGEEERFNYSHVKKILQNYDKHKGVVSTKYRKTDQFGILRDYTDGVQALPTKFRGLLCKNMTDVDVVNCHPTIILNICKKHNINCLYLEDYCKNRKALLIKDTTKIDILRSINKKQKLKNVSAWMQSFDNEMKQIQQRILSLPEYEPQREMAKASKNMEGTFMSHVATTHEVIILHTLLKNVKVEVGVLMFDGFMFYGDKPDNFLTYLSELVLDRTGFEINFSYKEHDHSLVIPSTWKVEDAGQLYETLKNKYETDYSLSFIESNVCYSYKVNDKIKFYSPSEIVHLFETEYVGQSSFWSLWVKDPTRRSYKDVGVYPHDVSCPDGILNLWTGYAVEKLPPSSADITPILQHIQTLMKTEEINGFFLDWLANMLQFPSSQSILIVMKSEEGAGKSAIVDFISYILGKGLYYECQDVKENLFGKFNGHLAGNVFININETERKEMMPFIEKIKTMITSPVITIEEKGQKKYVEDNKRHFIMTCNNDNPVAIKEGSRRFFYVESSDELIGKTDYFNELYAFIERKSSQRAFYQFLMERQVKRKLTVVDIPVTQDMKNMYELNRDPVEDYTMEFRGKLTSMDNYNSYKQYLHSNGLKYEISKKNFDMKFAKYIDKYNITKKRETINGIKETVYSTVCLLADAPRTDLDAPRTHL